MLNWLSQKVSINWLKAVITIVALGVIALRVYYPDLKIDAVTFGLMVVAILPWLSELIESAKFPGGWEVKFRDVKEARAKVTTFPAAGLGCPATRATQLYCRCRARPEPCTRRPSYRDRETHPGVCTSSPPRRTPSAESATSRVYPRELLPRDTVAGLRSWS